MTIDVLRQEFVIGATPDAVLAHLLDPQSYIGLNPFVIAVRDVRQQEDGTAYTAVEHLTAMRVLSWDNLLQVESRVESGERFVMHLTAKAGITVHIVTDVTPDPAGAAVRDTMTLSAPRLLSRYVLKMGRAGHLHRVATLKARLEQP
ncbi:MAG: hypothetical protein ABW000_14175 [Actinoplanes sp.]